MYLWGSAGVTENIKFDKPLLLHIRNDVFGEVITFGTMASGTQTTIGTLQPGECVSIPLQGVKGQGITGVYATCPPITGQTEPPQSVVACLIRE